MLCISDANEVGPMYRSHPLASCVTKRRFAGTSGTTSFAVAVDADQLGVRGGLVGAIR
jgi:hypothetical protein